MVRVCVQVA